MGVGLVFVVLLVGLQSGYFVLRVDNEVDVPKPDHDQVVFEVVFELILCTQLCDFILR